jgi:hypothetical protein
MKIQRIWRAFFVMLAMSISIGANAQEALFESIGASSTANLPEHVSKAQKVRVNRRALQAPSLSIDISGEQFTAIRDRVERQKKGQLIWVGHLQGNPGNTVIVTLRGNDISALIQTDSNSYRLGLDKQGQRQLYQIDFGSLPEDDAADLPAPDSYMGEDFPVSTEATTNQDLLVVYNQLACNYAGSCGQLETNIMTAVTDLNTAYQQSGIDITMTLVGMEWVDYAGTGASATLTALRSTTDGIIDIVHTYRDALGADIVSMVYDGDGCGIGYRPSSATSAFNVTDVPCMVGNRTMAHEIGHNQGAHHDRVTVGGGGTGDYLYGYRRCDNNTAEDVGSPYFRTVLSYSCTAAPRVGRFSNPNFNYLGVPQGIDPDLQPSLGAFNARTLNESAAYVAGFRSSVAVIPPSAPANLDAVASGTFSMSVSWGDTSGNESSFELQRSLDGSGWSTIATLGANDNFHEDNGLNALTTYFYQVRASNSEGNSAYSNADSDTTFALPASVEDHANGESSTRGSVTGSYTATQADGGSVQTITETSSGGRKSARRQSFTHTWLFDVFGGSGGVLFDANAWVSGSEGANFYYSLDGGSSWTLMFTVDSNLSSNSQSFALPGSASDDVRVQARDAAQSNGEAVDTLSVDYMVITSYTTPGDPPAAPSGLSVGLTTSNSVDLSFTDNADDEFGFDVWRSDSDPGAVCSGGASVGSAGTSAGTGGGVSFTDPTAAAEATYWYWVLAFNGGGDSGCSNVVSATTTVAPAISITSINGYKVKGKHTVDLTWTGVTTGTADIFRNTTLIPTANDGAHTDNIGAKGGATYTYKVCDAGSTTVCSGTVTVTF